MFEDEQDVSLSLFPELRCTQRVSCGRPFWGCNIRGGGGQVEERAVKLSLLCRGGQRILWHSTA